MPTQMPVSGCIYTEPLKIKVSTYIARHGVELASPYTNVGSYPILYIDAQGCALCPACALESEKRGEPMQAGGVNYGSHTYCDECGDDIEAAYPEGE